MIEKKMTRREMCKVTATGIVLTTLGSNKVFAAQELQSNMLPKPSIVGKKSLMQALKERKSSRQFSEKKLSLQILSDLLWAADGINRTESGKRTAPSAWNWQNIDIYLATSDGVFLFDEEAHMLEPYLSEDIRKITGTQPFVEKVPVNLVYVANYEDLKIRDFKAKKRIPAPATEKEFNSIANAGFIAQNVYLYAASEGLATVVRSLIDRETLAKVMKLRPDQKIILAQSVGYPKE